MRMNQYKRIENYINKHGSITQADASKHLGISKLSTRIGEMSRKGYSFEKVYESGKNRWNEPCHYMRYSFKDGGAN